jgi:hypothetical protein
MSAQRACSPRPAHLVLLGVLSLVAGGCSAVTAVTRDTYIRDRTAQVVYPMPLEEVWQSARELLSEQGYNGLEAPGSFTYESEWREEMAPSRIAGTFTKYLVRGIRMPDDRCRVVFTKMVKSARDQSTSPEGQVTLGDQNAKSATRERLRNAADTGEGGRPGNDSHYTAADLQYQSEHNTGSLKQAADSREGNRDFAMEFALLKKVAPEAAAQIEAEAAQIAP